MSEIQSYADRVQSVRDPAFWQRWAQRVLLLLGAVHLLAGIVFFFAYNWDDLSALTKFGLLQCAVVASFIGALKARLDHPVGEALLIFASVFTGVLLAVIGQVYQTGADAWQLFVAWVALILPWMFVSRSSVHLFLWIVLLLTAISLYGEQRLVALGHIDRNQLATLIGLPPVGILILREFATKAGVNWLSVSWLRRALATITLFSLIVPALSFVFETTSSAIPGFLAFIFLAISFGFVYSRWLDDYAVVAISIAFATVFAMAAVGHIIFEVFQFSDGIGSLVFSLLLLAGSCVILTSITVKLLRGIHAYMEKRAADD